MGRRVFRTIGTIAAILICAGILTAAALNWHVCKAAENRIGTAADVSAGAFDCILVLGCSVREDGTPSAMLNDRVLTGIELYNQGAAPKLIMIGDHGRQDYNEVQVMKDMAIEAGVPDEDVFMDHAGFSTYESLYRAKEIFGVERILIVTQEYHLYRAVYIAQELNMTAYGVSADIRPYAGQWMRDLREIAARVKDFFSVWFQVEPTYLGEVIPVWGDGSQTND